MDKSDKIITVFGTARPDGHERICSQAEELGGLIAEQGWGVATGGGPAIMDAVSKGCYVNEGYVEAYTISLPFEETTTEYAHKVSKYKHFSARQRDLMLVADALVAFPGGSGTLYEVYYALTEMACQKREKKPIVLIDSKFWNKLIDFKFHVEQGMVSQEILDLIVFAETPEEAMQHLRNQL